MTPIQILIVLCVTCLVALWQAEKSAKRKEYQIGEEY